MVTELAANKCKSCSGIQSKSMLESQCLRMKFDAIPIK